MFRYNRKNFKSSILFYTNILIIEHLFRLMLMLLRRSVRSTIGMARDNSTCSTLVTSCMPWDSTSPRRSACKMANKKKRTRNSPASTKLSPWSTLPWRPPKTTATTMTTLNCANCTTKTKMEPWCWLNLKTSCPTWVRYENSLSKSGYVN